MFADGYGVATVIPIKDLASFTLRRARKDSLSIFLWRMLRFLFISPFLLRYSVLRGRDLIEREIMGSGMLLDSRDKGISQDLLVNGLREPFLTEIINDEIKDGEVIVDIGANIGYYVLQESLLVGQRGKVYAIEPVHGNIEILERNIRLNGYENIEVFELAIGDKNGMGEIMVSELRNRSSMVASGMSYIYSSPIEIVMLDTFLQGKRHPDIIKMDVEGYEYEIIRGCKELLASGRPLKIFMELHFDILLDKSIEIVKMLKDAGFILKEACFELHPAVMKSRLGMMVISFLDGRLGAATGHQDIDIEDLLNDEKYRTGQVENLELFFER